MSARAATAALTLLLPAAAEAHDLWVVAPSGCAVDAPCELRVTQGMTFPDGEGPAPTTARLTTRALGPDGEALPTKVGEPDELAARYSFQPKQAGLHIFAIETAAREIELEAKAFNHYLVSDGMPQVYRARHEAGTLDHDAVERYQKFVKALVSVGAPEKSKRWSTPIGHALEIVPLDPPHAARVGEVLRFRVLFRGRPLPEAHVGWSHPGRGDRPVGTVRTDARGEAAVPITQAGLTSLRLTHMEHRPKAKPAWRSTWTTLTFRVPGA